MLATDWYIIDNVDELDTPALVVYPDRVQYNINLLKTMIDDPSRLRPHVKTHKSIDATGLMMQSGIKKFKCATIAEAEMLGMAGAYDVLLAYQPTGPKLRRFVRLISAYPQTAYSCLVDNTATANAISKEAADSGINISVYIDLNVGMNRTGIIPDVEAFALYELCAALPGLELKGLHAYDGHIHDADYSIREKRSEESIKPVLKLVDDILAKGYPNPKVIAGGSPTFPILAKLKDIEVSPGTFAYWDRGYQQAFPEQAFQTAALIVARVVSLPDEGKICIDLGHKSVSAENELNKRVYFLNASELKFTGQSEEHLVADAGEGHHYKVGDTLYGLPHHICPSVALYERAITIENKLVTGEWKTIARDRKITI
ncbi:MULTISPECIES: D-TA family PLP-dependent enzyme [unclassified Mucilaginibacter]|uniref:D-TA family PLP-dependent enzyme n=1 Tax=unclassified Mucilaginibacter TaxID=2617802 RepID=UPI002AC8EA92|nr:MULTISPECIES: D-TA family PLP-dependent enzyme [unclassified Mucilaginibacter]MEB0248675.1 D-TA family PLP-dependent enzyme [Mucilaginibacter sp. 5B2]MEB0262493.1 D-TA family PLP-dependent enzyme [Mucilaginibacter sp. 10I4]MEB0279933.1 D-TA family PLP-dependent enzyme [Mucilaginibacter sp. 10B2]MEB0300079.1 D-TA family PLP-dependent enzyme [Mucilaginibacter sp. 5C4]WPX21891.1 D-TA family PLP-dependent enzyme [Mucilaginibacter sp. 5C4]